MSTRCQVKVVQEQVGWDDAVTLYHHWDGYPENMVRLFQQIPEMVRETHKKRYANIPLPNGNKEREPEWWEMGRAGKLASFLCAIDPGLFEPEAGHERHGDIEWYYTLHTISPVNNRGERPRLVLDVEDVYHHRVYAGLDLMSLTAKDIEALSNGTYGGEGTAE